MLPPKPETPRAINVTVSKAEPPEVIQRDPDDAVVTELMAIIEKTESEDTFMATLSALAQTGKAGKKAVPAILRGAERVGILKGLARAADRGQEPSRLQATVFETVETLLKADGTVGGVRRAMY